MNRFKKDYIFPAYDSCRFSLKTGKKNSINSICPARIVISSSDPKTVLKSTSSLELILSSLTRTGKYFVRRVVKAFFISLFVDRLPRFAVEEYNPRSPKAYSKIYSEF